MKRKTAIIIVVALVILLGVAGLLNRPMVHAVGRVIIKIEDGHHMYSTNPTYFSDLIQETSNYLSSADGKRTLAQWSQAKVDDFEIVQVSPVRSTRIVWLEFRASNSNIAWNVASNAAFLVEARYATNQAGILVERIDTEFWQPPSAWSSFVNRLEPIS